MSRIGIDIRCLAEGRRTGVEEYTRYFLKNLLTADKENEYVLFLNSFKKPKADLEWVKEYPNVSLKITRYPNKLLNFFFWYLGWPKIDSLIGGVDVFFLPNIIFGAVSQKAKLFATIHDLSFERYPETFSMRRQLWHNFINPKKIVKRADRIIAVSESTKNDLISLYGIDPQKIRVILSGVDLKFRVIGRNDGRLVAVKEKYSLPYKFILYLGTIEPRKNIAGVVRAFNFLQADAKKEGNDELQKYKLVIAGHRGWLSGEIFSEIENSEFRDQIIFTDFVADEDKEYLYNLASAFVYPSFFEGFGFPVLEAMACGIPTVTSNNSSLPEIAGPAAILIDPNKPEEIFLSLREILTQRELAEKMKSAGLARAQNFQWPKAAREFISLIKEVK
jgi:glycosyltransferase involved in cell wall biosynthesis